jgi:mRNA interferase MazF
MTAPARGEVWLVDLSPIRGHEQAGLAIVLPMTSTVRSIPSQVAVSPPEGGLKTKSAVLCEAIRSISTDRLIRRWGAVAPATLATVEDRLRILLRL